MVDRVGVTGIQYATFARRTFSVTDLGAKYGLNVERLRERNCVGMN